MEMLRAWQSCHIDKKNAGGAVMPLCWLSEMRRLQFLNLMTPPMVFVQGKVPNTVKRLYCFSIVSRPTQTNILLSVVKGRVLDQERFRVFFSRQPSFNNNQKILNLLMLCCQYYWAAAPCITLRVQNGNT